MSHPATFTHPTDPPSDSLKVIEPIDGDKPKVISSPNSPWNNPAVVAKMVELWSDHAASQIAKKLSAEFGVNFTRNSIVGKASRLGLTASDKSEDGKRAMRPKRNPSRPKLKIVANGSGLTLLETIESSIPALRVLPGVPLNFSLVDLPEDGCRYIAGDDSLYCGHPRREKSSFCTGHHQIVWLPPTDRNARLRGFR